MLEFDARTTQLLNTAYEGADFTRRRQASFDALRPGPGETILDIGCGNGLLTAELARAVGADGRVVGIDPSTDMRSAAAERCRDFVQVELLEGRADSLPVGDGAADKAAAVQVFEYIDDLDAACAEAMRALKPGGRLVVSDLHFDSLIWFSDEPERMQALIDAWDHHFASGEVPARLPALLRAAGHEIEDVRPFTLSDHVLKPDGIAMMMMHLMKAYAVANDLVAPDVADAWFDEQRKLAVEGRFFFSITQFVVVARKAG